MADLDAPAHQSQHATDSDEEAEMPAAIDVLPASMLDIEGVQPLLREEDLQASCVDFLQWLSQPPLTQCEALVKARRVKSVAQLQPIKLNLRFIFALLYDKQMLRKVDMSALTRLSVCQALFEAMSERRVGSGRFHAIFLLIKKVLVCLASRESTALRQYLQPTIFDSFLYVDGVCSDSSYRRKQEQRNRAVLGVCAGQALAKSLPQQQPRSFVVPGTWSSPPSTATNAPAITAVEPSSRAPPSNKQAQSPAAKSAAELSKTELQQVARGCMQYLSERVSDTAAAVSANGDQQFMAHLVTATLCLGLAPRSQILAKLRIGSSFVKQAADGRYWVQILAEQSKNGKPTTFAIAEQLTPALDYYIDTIRPRLLAAMPGGISAHDYLFVKRNGTAPRTDFSSCTTLVAQRYIGRPINAHAFRAAVITTFYQAGASQSEMDTLASIMAHDPSTARNFYFRPQFGQAAVQTNEKMTSLLLEPPAAASTAAASEPEVQ
jgi:hypothetical protein